MFYLLVAVKLILGFLALVLVINLTGKGNLAPASASDQVQNYVLGGIVGGVIYNPKITIAEFLLILVIWFALVLSLRWLKKHNNLVKRMVDGQLIITQMDEEKPKYPLITDGVIQHATLEMIDKDEAWLLAALQAQGYAEVDAVFLAEYDSGEITVTGY